MADSHPPSGAGVGPFMNPVPPFPPQPYRQGTPPPPPPPPYRGFAPNPSAPQGFSAPGHVHHHQQPQQHYQTLGPRFPAPPPPRPPWVGYGFHGPPPSYGPQASLQGGTPGPPAKMYPVTTPVTQNTGGPPSSGFGLQRTSIDNPTSHSGSLVTSLGHSTSLLPGTELSHSRTSNLVQSTHDTPRSAQSNWIINVGSQTNGYSQAWNSAPGTVSLVGGTSAAVQNSATAEREYTDSGSSRPDSEEGVNVVEKAISDSRKVENVDLKVLISRIRFLVSEVEQVAEQFGNLLATESISEETLLVACPFDPAHMIAPDGLFHHYLSCPSNPNPPLDVQSLLASLQYRTSPKGNLNTTDSSTPGTENSKKTSVEQSSASLSFSKPEFDIWGGQFFYDGAPAVVQAPLHTVHSPQSSIPPVPGRDVIGLFKVESDALEPNRFGEMSFPACAQILLPSRFLLLSEEVESWKFLPSRSSSLVAEAASGLDNLRKSVIVNWLLVHSPAHGIVLDSTLACHIYSLAKLCFKEANKQATVLMDSTEYKQVIIRTLVGLKDTEQLHPAETGVSQMSQEKFAANVQTDLSKSVSCSELKSFCPKVGLLDCAQVFRPMDWLAAQLCPLYGPAQSRILSLNLLKHSIISSARFLLSRGMNFIDRRVSFSLRNKVEGRCESKAASESKETESTHSHPSGPAVILDDPRSHEAVAVEASNPQILELEAAISAVTERAVFERYLRTPLHSSRVSKFEMTQLYQAAVQLAKEERMKRPNYRAVLEYDGLIWHRSQLEDKNKNKTREELLAEERDYKRRRMSYRGKKLKRTPTQVVRDIIEGHMEEIVSTGGIGSFGKQSDKVEPVETLINLEKKSVVTKAASLTDAEPSSTFSSVRRNAISDANEKGGIRREQSRSQLDLNEGFTLFPKTMSETEGFVGREGSEEQPERRSYNNKADAGSRRYSKSRTGREDSKYIDHDGGKYSSFNHRNKYDDYKDSSRTGNEALKRRPFGRDNYQTERLSSILPERIERDSHQSSSRTGDKEDNPLRGDRHTAREAQSRGTR
ncbi:U11/U12 small nuclear ribonucleoprotein 48 kDa protein [Marchantia polymorpha subsp. ruderalis]|uniref:CHHC U11-48K-type domain-containing protein n=2 Tax=Marchantia polymorpha TaxID=3197 RepID=A0AAF6ASG9_MARPO|nr:hypothetical protein MARPO_0001s0430 [Marchantia polymorpha]BBM99389.1 hypothetical protein Mp_1g20950 [Marchantia polymorpha subsp. ruderalis]|eukprot:PTQ50471.1 hypothetical protein MARPO_0001s0430 [Marchantia polymorpha]